MKIGLFIARETLQLLQIELCAGIMIFGSRSADV